MANRKEPQGTVTLWLGTRKGAFCFTSRSRKKWTNKGLQFAGTEVHHVVRDPRDPSIVYAAVNSPWFGPHLHVSRDGGQTFEQSDEGLAIQSLPETSVARIWHIEPGHAEDPGVVWAGVDPGCLFRSADWGKTWDEVRALNNHPTRERWQPGAGGMTIHSIQCPKKDQIIVGISAAGAFRSSDGGQSWEPFNGNVLADFAPEKYPEVGQCVHKLLEHPGAPGTLYQQNHCGVYRASFDAPKWTDISKGLPTRFGFGMALPAAEPKTVFTVPIESPAFRCNPDGAFRVARSRDKGKTWKLLTKGLPQKGAHLNVFREAMTADSLDPAGVYVGTSGGILFYSRNAGDRWEMLSDTLPPIYSVSVSVA